MHDKGDDGDEEQQADERRKIVTWAKRQGYQVVTQLVGQVSPREDGTDCNRPAHNATRAT